MSSKPPDIGEQCYVFEKFGKCPYGTACRFGGSHLTSEFVNVVTEGLYDPQRPSETHNLLPKQLQEALRKKRVSFERSEQYLKRLREAKDSGMDERGGGGGGEKGEMGGGKEGAPGEQGVERLREAEDSLGGGEGLGGGGEGLGKEVKEDGVSCKDVENVKSLSGAVTDEGEIRLRRSERRTVRGSLEAEF